MTSVTKKSAKKIPRKRGVERASRSTEDGVKFALKWLEEHSTPRDRDNLKRFGINATKAFGVSMSNIQALGKTLGRDHALAAALWDTGWYEARMLTSFVDDPALVTSRQMDQWCRDFDNWGICDTFCFCLFDRTPHAWAKVAKWAGDPAEFVKRAAFALLASLAGHDKRATDAMFIETLPLIERAATDDRDLVKKGVSWALRRIGRRNAALHTASLTLARRLAESDNRSARWIGKDALRELNSAKVTSKLSA